MSILHTTLRSEPHIDAALVLPTHLRLPTVRALTVRLGLYRSICVVVAVSVLVSMSTTLLILDWLSVSSGNLFSEALTISVCVPLLVATPATWLVVRLTLRAEYGRQCAQRLATIDSLTGAVNRRQFFILGEQELARAARSSYGVALLLLDLDHFKQINDSHGHATGDTVLKAAAQSCAEQLRPSDILVRLGGEEFAILLSDVSEAQALEVAERVRLAIQSIAISLAGGAVVRPTVSIGVRSRSSGDTTSLEKLLVAADQAMYAAKRGGRNRVRSSSGGGTPQDLHAPRSLEISARRGLPMTALIIPANPSRARAIPRDSNAVARISEAIVRSGRLRTTLWLTALSIVVSINCGIVTLLAVGGLHQDGLVLIGMCVTVPSLMVPPIGWFSANLSLEAEAAQRVAETLATTDPLTGLCNRRHFLELADSEFERSRRSRRPLAVLLMDIDHFKSINDTQGHAAGDKVLTHVAQLCRGNTRMQDTTARLGGEEFVVLLPDTPIETAREVAERVRAAVAENTALCQPDGAAIRATVSIGVAVIASNDNSAEHLLERADRAMYAAKDAGRNRVRSSGVPPQHSPVAVCI